jgi:hypothetical protein
MLDVARAECKDPAWDACKEQLPKPLVEEIRFLSGAAQRGEDASQATWSQMLKQFSNYTPDSTFSKCYASGWWEPEIRSTGASFSRYPNGTAFAATERAFFESLPGGGKGFPLNAKTSFCFCASAGVDALRGAMVGESSRTKWGVLLLVMAFLFATVIAEIYLLCCTSDEVSLGAFQTAQHNSISTAQSVQPQSVQPKQSSTIQSAPTQKGQSSPSGVIAPNPRCT